MSTDTLPTDPGVLPRTPDQRSPGAVTGGLATRARDGARARSRGACDDRVPNPPAPATYDSLGAFVAEDARRELRNEREVGDFWLADGFPPAAWRAAWLPGTRELYMQRIGGVVPGGRVTVVAHLADEAALAARLAGWEDVAGTDGSVHWLLKRLGLDDSHLPATASAGDA
jgi:hypothetical protein